MKKLIALVAILMLSTYSPKIQASAFGSVFDQIASYALQAANALIFAQDLIDVASYPNEYIKKVNAIIRDVNSLKNLALNTNLSDRAIGDLGVQLQGVTLTATQSLKTFSSIINEMTEYTTMISLGMSVKLSETLRNIKTSHAQNMSYLNSTHNQIYALRSALAQKSQMQSSIDKTKNFDIYKNRKK